ncbi:Rv3235 family protein [Krasilnikovia sp. MM14-A1259]|uniref:Rv3235 family protein n=1 Tax=Krasilnikovia sp. MM14-A1259 TaxID=3373539 RepID=UPI00380B4B9D
MDGVTTVEVAPRRGARPPIRIRPVPPCDPPFDDEVDPSVWAPAHQPAFRWPGADASRRTDPGRAAEGIAGRRAVAAGDSAGAEHGSVAAGGSAVAASSASGPGPVSAGASAEARVAVQRFVGACVEVLNGFRPAAHLRRLALPSQAARVVAQAVVGTHRVAELRKSGHRRATDRHGRGGAPAAVLRVRLCEPRPGAVEATVLLVTGGRTWALALRLELHDQTWLVTTLQLV